MDTYRVGDLLGCKECSGEFRIERNPEEYDPTYCPYCGSESLTLQARGDEE